MAVHPIREQDRHRTDVGLPVITAPIFVGGVPRSGTTVVGKRLLGRHPSIACTVPAEMWFLTDTGGLCDVVGAVQNPKVRLRLRAAALRRGHLNPLAAFDDRMNGFWYSRPWWRDGRDKGLCQSVGREELRSALAAFRSAFRDDPVAAGRVLAADLIDPSVRRRGKSRWVDTTPANAARIDDLYRIFPDLKLVHMVRDGRDVAASIVSRGWGTDSFDRALRQWYAGMRANYAAIARIPLERFHTVRLEELLGPGGPQRYGALLRFLGIEDSPKMRHYFHTQMSPEAGHVGRWRRDVSRADLARIDRTYEHMLARLERDGIPLPAG
jgi:hypothetical protein